MLKTDAASWIPRAGETIAGRYRVEKVIGCGGMAAVVSAQHIEMGERIAIKLMHPTLATEQESLDRFVREARATSRIKNEHVVRVIDVGTTDGGLPFIAMELLEGEDLGSLLSKGPLSIELAVDCVLQAAEGLADAHALGIVHRDIKPSNLWFARRLDGTPLVKVLDFGISKFAPPGAVDVRLTETHAVFGSPTYMSPEQIRSAKKVDAKTDVWALGIVLFELLTSKLPFDGENVGSVLASISADPPTPLRAVRPDAPQALEQAILRCLDKGPAQRATLTQLARSLRPLASPLGVRSAEYVERVAPPAPTSDPSMSMPAPATTETMAQLAYGATERSVTTTHSVPSAAGRSRSRRLAAAACVAAIVAGGGWGAYHYERSAMPRTDTMLPLAPVSAEPLPLRTTAVTPTLPTTLSAPSAAPTPPASSTSATARTTRRVTSVPPRAVGAGSAVPNVAPPPPPPPPTATATATATTGATPPAPTSEGRE